MGTMSAVVMPLRSRERSVGPPQRDGDSVGKSAPVRRLPSSAPVHPLPSGAPVLLVGADAGTRALLRTDLAAGLPRGTRFVEAQDLAQALERAPFCRAAILVGDLPDSDADSLTGLLARHHPRLAVLRVQAEPPSDCECFPA
jgi:hypothetical protein